MNKENLCKNCGNELEYNKEWDQKFDRMDKTYPDVYKIRVILANKGVPKYICKTCGSQVITID